MRTRGPISVLHVDDDGAFVEMAATFVERTDDRIAVETATDADEALERLASDEFDCVVSDYEMPGTTGIELLETIREERPNLPFILFTGKGSESVASDAISAGATDYLQKAGGTEQYELLANRIRNTVERYRTRKRAAELDRVRTLTSDVNKALVRADSRAEIETRICELMTGPDRYRFAWIGGVNPETGRVEPRASAGDGDGYLDEITVTADETPTGEGPGGTAIRERRVAVSQRIDDDPGFAPWREAALARGYRSVAAVPLEYGGTLYGVLAVYADRPDAFDERERALLDELGEDVAHAVHSLDVRDRLREERDRRWSLFDNAPTPVIEAELREEGDGIRITDANDAFEEVFGYEIEDVVGEDPSDVVVPEGGIDRHQQFRRRTAAGEAITTEVERTTADGSRTFLLHVVPYGADDGGPEGMYAWYTDVSEGTGRQRVIERLHATNQAMLEAGSAEEVARVVVDAARDILGMPSNGVHLYDGDAERLRPVAWTDRAAELVDEIPTFEPGGSLAWEAFEAGETRVYDDVSTEPGRHTPDTAVRSEIILPLADHGVLLVGSTDPGAFDETDVSLARTLATHATTALNRIERESELARRTELFESILETSVEGILVVDENRESVTWNERFVDMWEVPEEVVEERSEEEMLARVRDRLENPEEFVERVEALYERPDEESRARVRLSDGRVFDRYSAPLESADGTRLGRVWFFRDVTDRERRERELERQNERLEEFAGVVSHDLRNPLNVAEMRIELAREAHESEHLDAAARSVERSLALVDDLLTLAREGGQTVDPETVDLAEAVAGCWENVDTGDATLTVETDRRIRADRGRLKQLLENLIRNAVEHGSTSSRSRTDDGGTDSGGVAVTVGDLPDGFHVTDDGPGIPEERREEVFEAGYSTAEEGTGFGLNIVREVGEAHGWGVRATDGPDGGARFEITGVETVDG